MIPGFFSQQLQGVEGSGRAVGSRKASRGSSSCHPVPQGGGGLPCQDELLITTAGDWQHTADQALLLTSANPQQAANAAAAAAPAQPPTAHPLPFSWSSPLDAAGVARSLAYDPAFSALDGGFLDSMLYR